MFWKRLFSGLRFGFLTLIFVIIVAPEWPDFNDERYKIDNILGQRNFDFLVWELNALEIKGEAALVNGQRYISDETRHSFVLDYLENLAAIRSLESEINAVYSDPEVKTPGIVTADLQRDVDRQREELEKKQPLAEAILQDQVASILVREGFNLLGSAWPPVEMHMTPLPSILIVSPREEIRQIYNIPLVHNLPTPIREEIESNVDKQLDRSSLIVPIGGLGMYPAMIVETSNINALAETVAHEWAHHWLTLHPIGLSYASSPELRTINETVASIVGNEIGAKVIEQYYPEYIPAPPSQTEGDRNESENQSLFDFNTEMAKTRVHVDDLLTKGKVTEAEEYMELRRQFFWENGYRIRKLNQAFFAFYGAYADKPGEQGDDPIGPAILAIREDSTDLREFLGRMASVRTLKDLQDQANEIQRPENQEI